MQQNRFDISSRRLVVVSIVLAAAAGFYIVQDDSMRSLQKAPAATAPSQNNTQEQPKYIAGASEFKPSCDSVSPFGAINVDCKPTARESTDSAGGAASSNPVQAPELPNFINIEVLGSGSDLGVAAAALKADRRNLGGTRQNSDSMLINAFALSETDVLAAVKDAHDRGLTVILDGKDSRESSAKINKVMEKLGVGSLEGGTSYFIQRGGNGGFSVVPLQIVKDEKGVRPLDQIHSIFNIRKNNI